MLPEHLQPIEVAGDDSTDPDIEAQGAMKSRSNSTDDRLFGLVDRLVTMSDTRSGQVVEEVRAMSQGVQALTARVTWMLVLLALGGFSTILLVVVAFLGLSGSIALPGGVHIQTSHADTVEQVEHVQPPPVKKEADADVDPGAS